MSTSEKKIGIFDSGVGGLTVMREIRSLLPHEDLIYFGDTARVPYGNKSQATIERYTLECAQFLTQLDVKLLVIACHTACAYAFERVSQELDIPVIGVMHKGVEELLNATKTHSVAILSTRGTANSQTYPLLLKTLNPQVKVTSLACPLFVPLIEEGFDEHPLAELIAKEYLTQLPSDVDAVLLACTHYPLLAKALKAVLGPRIQLIDPGSWCAKQVQQALLEQELFCSKKTPGTQEFFVSDDPHHFMNLGKRFFCAPLDLVSCHLPHVGEAKMC